MMVLEDGETLAGSPWEQPCGGADIVLIPEIFTVSRV
jgi:hypothetical protein